MSDDVVVVLPYQIGGESFALGAVVWGRSRNEPKVVVVHDPRNRQEFYTAIVPFTRWIDEYFQAFADDRDTYPSDMGQERTVARRSPQIVVPNSASAQLLGRIGRRLAYPGASKFPVPASLIPAGRHLLFLRDQLRVPGQQLVLPLTDLLADHWSTPQTETERLSLPALFAWVDPPAGLHGFAAADAAENSVHVGPVPPGEHDERLYEYVTERRRRTAAGQPIAALDSSIGNLWNTLLYPAWNLCWDALEEEAQWAEAPSVTRRWANDRSAYTRHIDWQRTAGRRRLRERPLQAARKLDAFERASSRLEAEMASDDLLRMIPYALHGSAVIGTVARVDSTNRERDARGRMRTYPTVTVRCAHSCPMPIGNRLYWADEPAGCGWLVVAITPVQDGTTTVTLRRERSSQLTTNLPLSGSTTAFSELSINTFTPMFPREADVPWTHRAVATDAAESIDDPIGAIEDPPVGIGNPRDRDREE